MRYRVEYLWETTEELSVCAANEFDGELPLVELQARVEGVRAKRDFGAGGFQIRDLREGGLIVALETFDDPLGGFWPYSGDYVIH
ncbi:MAG: hypothetical protein AB7O98_08445 [Hyphomonadaceae bacterium]